MFKHALKRIEEDTIVTDKMLINNKELKSNCKWHIERHIFTVYSMRNCLPDIIIQQIFFLKYRLNNLGQILISKISFLMLYQSYSKVNYSYRQIVCITQQAMFLFSQFLLAISCYLKRCWGSTW